MVRRSANLLALAFILISCLPSTKASPKTSANNVSSHNAKTHGVTRINGAVPPGIEAPAVITLLLRGSLGPGLELHQYRTVRQPGTRAPIHTHPYGGSTCMIKGESTVRIEGEAQPHTIKPGECFLMPGGPAMVNFNSGNIPFEAIDTFVLKKGEKPIKVLEPGRTHVFELDL